MFFFNLLIKSFLLVASTPAHFLFSDLSALKVIFVVLCFVFQTDSISVLIKGICIKQRLR